jgi:ABC-type transport system involved in multi-copper enzyme maturation permease subunit
MSRLRSIGLVAGFDLYESLRSRKAIALLAVYVVVALAGTALFASALNEAMLRLQESVGSAEAADKLLQSEQMVDLISELLRGDEELARALLAIPPLALFYAWFAINFMPLVIALTSADAISGEVSTGSVRYVLFRVDRFGWAAGKLAGQTLLLVVGIVAGAAAAFVLGIIMIDTFDVAANAWWLLRMSGRSAFYGFAYLGVAMCASQLVRGTAASRALAILFAFLCSLFGGILSLPPVVNLSPTLVKVARTVFPNAHANTLFRPEIVERGTAMLALTAIGLAFFGIGFLRFSKRDA